MPGRMVFRLERRLGQVRVHDGRALDCRYIGAQRLDLRQRCHRLQLDGDYCCISELRHVFPEDVSPGLAVIQLLKQGFSCILSYILPAEDFQDLVTVMTEIVFFDKTLETCPVLIYHYGLHGNAMSSAIGDALRVAPSSGKDVVDESFSLDSSSAGQKGIICILSVRGRRYISYDAVYSGSMEKMVLRSSAVCLLSR